MNAYISHDTVSSNGNGLRPFDRQGAPTCHADLRTIHGSEGITSATLVHQSVKSG
jgi:hypothetical protein